jgi:hypothetical protein
LDGDGVPTACYWEGSSRTDMPEYGSAAYSIYVDGGTVYIAGEYYSVPHGESWIPCYWKGTERTELWTPNGPLEGYATSVAVSAGVVYTAGNYRLGGTWIPLYWTDATWTELPTAGRPNSGYAYSIFLEGGKVYSAGRYYNGVGWIACYWENDTRIDLPGGSGAAYGIFFDSGTVYAAGEYFSGNEWYGCYWVNSTRHVLSIPSAVSVYATDIFVYDGDAYSSACAQDYSSGDWVPFYWKNQMSTELPRTYGAGNGYAKSIFVSEGTVYSCGYYHNGSVYVPCFWKDTTRTDLPASEGSSKGLARLYGKQMPALGWRGEPLR